MDFPVKGKADDYSFKYDIMDSKSEKYPSGDMSDDWAPPDDIFSLFPIDNDFLNNFGQTREFDSLDDLSAHLKMEVGDYELNSSNEFENDPITYEDYENVTAEEKNISSSSSDSGLSSDNLDMDMSPIFEPLSPAISSPGPSISERGAKNSPPRNEISFIEHQTVHKYPEKPVETRPKVIIQKIPQILTLPTKHIETSKGSLAGGKEIKIVKLPQQIFSAANNKKVTIQVKNSNTGARIQANPGTFFINNGKITEVKKLVRLQNAVNPRSVLLPVSMQDVKDLKNFKIVKAPITALKSDTTKISKVLPQEVKTLGKAKPFKLQDDSLSDQTSDGESYVYDDGNSYEYDSELKCFLDKGSETETPYPKLMLTAEEKRLLAKEGITLPTHYPLTKHEERELKRIRRKIRNKISAQDSRKRKREYVDGLEERVKQCTEENQTLLKRIKLLQNQNQNLVTQMKKLQTLLSKGTNKTAHPTTCLMVLLLSLALVAAPNLKLGQNIKEGELEEVMQDTVLQNRRNLLFDVKEQNLDIFDEDIDMAELVDMSEASIAQREFGQCFDNKRKFAQNNNEPLCKKPKFIDFDVDDQNWYHVKEMEKIKNLDSSDKLADKSQDDKKGAQTSGFNINPQLTDTNLFDQDVMEILTQKSNNLYDFTLDKLSGAQNDGPIIDFAAKHVYAEEPDKKLNLSELRNYQKY